MNTMTREAKVKIGFDIDKEVAKKAMSDTAKEAERLDKAIGKVSDRYKQVKEEFSANKSAVITGTLNSISRTAIGVSEEVGRMLSGFSVVSGIIDMFSTLNGNIQSTVKSLKDMRAVGGTLTQLQAAKLGGGYVTGAGLGAAAATAVAGTTTRGTIAGTVAGAAAGGAVVNAAGQFATTQALDGVVEKITEKFGKKAEKHIDDFIDAKFTVKKKPGSALVPVGGAGSLVPGVGGNFVDATWRYNSQGLLGGGLGGSLSTMGLGGALVPVHQQSIGEYVQAALMNAPPSSVPMTGLSRFLHNAGTEFYSPKNRRNLLTGGLAGGAVGSLIGYGATGSESGAGTGGLIGAAAGGAINVATNGALLKSAAAAVANPITLAIAAAVAAGSSVLLVKGGKTGDKVANSIAGWFLSFFDDAAEKAQKKLAAKLAEKVRRENADAVTLPIQNARYDAFEGLRQEQSSLVLHQQAVRYGFAGAGLDTAIEYGTQGIADANARLIQAQTARFRGIDLGRGGNASTLRKNEAEAYADFQSQMAAQRQLTDARAAGQLAVIDPEIANARGISAADSQRLAWMRNQQKRVNSGLIKDVDKGFTDTALAMQYEKAEQSARRLIDLEKQRGEIKRSTLEVQKQEFAVYREQVRAGEQAARQALAEKEGIIEAARQDFGTMNQTDRQYTMEIAKKLKGSGVSSLTEDEKQFALSNQNIFGSTLRPQLSALGDQVGFSDLQALVGLNTKKESDALKQAQALKVEVERNITAQLQANEEKLAEELASRFGPLFKSLTIILEGKFEQMMRQATNKIGSQIQDAKIQGG